VVRKKIFGIDKQGFFKEKKETSNISQQSTDKRCTKKFETDENKFRNERD